MNTQRNDQVLAIILDGSTADLADLNDGAVNAIRDYCRANGYNAAALFAEEAKRIDAGNLGLGPYLRVKRTGSRYRLTRAIRRQIWAAKLTRDILRDELAGFYDSSRAG
jgi:hypothetical protein